MNSGVLDLKMRRNVSLAPVDAGAERIAPLAAGEEKAPAVTKAAEAQASEIAQDSRIERVTEVLIVSIRCVKQVIALRFAQGSLARATRGVLRAISRLGDRSAGVPARPANGKAQRPRRPRRRRAPAFPSWTAMRGPSIASAACPRGRTLPRTPSLRGASSCGLPNHVEKPRAALPHP